MAHLRFLLLRQFPTDGFLSGRYKIGIQPFLLDQLRMGATLNDMGIIQYKYLICITNSFQPMGNHNDGLVMG